MVIQTAAALASIAAVAPRLKPSAKAPAVMPMMPNDELRHQSEPHPVVRACDAVLGIGDHEGRQRDAADVKRNDRTRVDPRRQQFHHTGQQH
jgi:hypothetical protein